MAAWTLAVCLPVHRLRLARCILSVVSTMAGDARSVSSQKDSGSRGLAMEAGTVVGAVLFDRRDVGD